MKIKDRERIIGNIKKNYELVTKACNLCLYIKDETFRHEHTFNIFKAFVQNSYYTERQHEFMGLTKPALDKNFAFYILTTEEV